jgi:hypothetical protein
LEQITHFIEGSVWSRGTATTYQDWIAEQRMIRGILNVSRCDLHIHSRYSARSEEWLFRRSIFLTVILIQRTARQLLSRGMDYATITDHDTIEGCLQIAHLPGTFI